MAAMAAHEQSNALSDIHDPPPGALSASLHHDQDASFAKGYPKRPRPADSSVFTSVITPSTAVAAPSSATSAGQFHTSSTSAVNSTANNTTPMNNSTNTSTNPNNAQQTTMATSSTTPIYPALYLFPLNDTFVPKHIYLNPFGEHVKIGRQTNAKSVPSSVNGYFDSKVLSRHHAEIWVETRKVFIRDIKSSNGTFLNSMRLSAESMESDPFEIHNDDILEFGIDIVSEETKMIVHRKVAAKAYVVIDQKDAEHMLRNLPNIQRSVKEQAYGMRMARSGPSTNLTVENMMNRLHYELQKSRETGAELGNLSTTMSEIQDTLSCALPPNATYAAPGKRQPPTGLTSHSSRPSDPSQTQAVASLQTQLNETKEALNLHINKVHHLETILADHEMIKSQVLAIRQMVMANNNNIPALNSDDQQSHPQKDNSLSISQDGNDLDKTILESNQNDISSFNDEDDDTSSIYSNTTVVAADDTDNKDKDSPSSQQQQLSSRSLPVNGEYNKNATILTDEAVPSDSKVANDSSEEASADQEIHKSEDGSELAHHNASLNLKLRKLSSELEDAVRNGQQLQSEHTTVKRSMQALEEKIQSLEQAIESRVTAAHAEAESRLDIWKRHYEESLQKERESWEVERVKLWDLLKSWSKSGGGSASPRLIGESESESDETEQQESDVNDGSLSRSPLSSAQPSATAIASPSSRSTRKGRKGRSRKQRRSSSEKRRRSINATSGESTDTVGESQSNTSRKGDVNRQKKGGNHQESGTGGSSSSEGTVASPEDDRLGGRWVWPGVPGSTSRHSTKNGGESIKHTEGVWDYSTNASAAPYVSAATVVVFGVAAWALMNRD